jgi:uncharacterized OB-fold protein
MAVPQNRMEPPITEVSGPFWQATRSKEFVLQWCKVCNTVIHYPRVACPTCLGTDLEWRQASGRGEVYARIIVHGRDDPYVVAIVDLEEGARFMTNIVNCPPEDVVVGMPVQVTWEDLSDKRALPLFEPVTARGSA